MGEENSVASEISRSLRQLGSLPVRGMEPACLWPSAPGGHTRRLPLASQSWVQGSSHPPRGAQWSSPWTHGIALWPLVLPSCPLGQGASPSRLWPATSLPHTYCSDFSLKGQSQPLSRIPDSDIPRLNQACFSVGAGAKQRPVPGPSSWGPRHRSWYRPWASVNPSVTPPPNTQMSRLGGAVPDCHIIAPEAASWALGMAGAPPELWKKAWEGGDGAPEQPSLPS